MSPLKDSDILDLPQVPDFISHPPELSMDELLVLCERMLPHTNAVRYSRPEPEFVGEPFVLLTLGGDS